MTAANWIAIIAAIVGGGGIAGFGGSLIAGLVQRPKVKADAVKLLTDAAVQQVNEMQEEVASARAEVAEARRHVRMLTAEVDACMRRLREWRAAILSPAATLPRLREMVDLEPGHNGRGD